MEEKHLTELLEEWVISNNPNNIIIDELNYPKDPLRLYKFVLVHYTFDLSMAVFQSREQNEWMKDLSIISVFFKIDIDEFLILQRANINNHKDDFPFKEVIAKLPKTIKNSWIEFLNTWFDCLTEDEESLFKFIYNDVYVDLFDL